MRRLPLWIAALLIATACATQETAQDEPSEPEPEEEIAETERVEVSAPEWYDRTVRSDSDSLYFYGYAHAVSSAESEAIELSEDMAITNLRFEVDRFAEDLRRGLEEEHGEDPYGTSRFIIDLRNAIQDLSFDDADVKHEFQDEEGAIDAYTKASLTISSVAERLHVQISDEAFREALLAHIE